MFNPFTSPFDLHWLEHDDLEYARKPNKIGNYPIDLPRNVRVLNYLIKERNSMEIVWGDAPEKLTGMVIRSMYFANLVGVDVFSRYIFLTIDQGWVDPFGTLRPRGFHIDGLQGNEVPTKRQGVFNTFWTNALPAEYVTHSFDLSGIDVSTHNIYAVLTQQAEESQVKQLDANGLYMGSAYWVHRSAVAKRKTYRQFVRISITHVPITNDLMTVNPDIEYDYNIHSTDGKMPEGLIGDWIDPK